MPPLCDGSFHRMDWYKIEPWLKYRQQQRTTWLEIRDFGPYFHTLHNAYFPISLLYYSGRRISKKRTKSTKKYIELNFVFRSLQFQYSSYFNIEKEKYLSVWDAFNKVKVQYMFNIFWYLNITKFKFAKCCVLSYFVYFLSRRCTVAYLCLYKARVTVCALIIHGIDLLFIYCTSICR